MASAASVVRRALLYVPGSSQKMLEKSRGLTVDCVAYDLEDSVTANKKDDARSNLRRLLEQPRGPNIKEYAVRINAVGSGLAEADLKAVCNSPNLDTIVIPKVNSASNLHWATDFIKKHRTSEASKGGSIGTFKILALIETARSVTDLSQICQASPLLSGLIFAAEDFALDLSLTRTPSLTEFLYARSAIATAARAYDLASTIDLVCTSFRGEEGRRRMEEECLGGRGLGFNGKQCIHPNQVEIAQRCFAPGMEEVEWAIRIVSANQKAEQAGKGAWTLDGNMIDAPVIGKAKILVQRAEACGIHMEALVDKWKYQKPQ